MDRKRRAILTLAALGALGGFALAGCGDNVRETSVSEDVTKGLREAGHGVKVAVGFVGDVSGQALAGIGGTVAGAGRYLEGAPGSKAGTGRGRRASAITPRGRSASRCRGWCGKGRRAVGPGRRRSRSRTCRRS